MDIKLCDKKLNYKKHISFGNRWVNRSLRGHLKSKICTVNVILKNCFKF